MSEKLKEEAVADDVNVFDPDNHVVTTALAGRVGRVTESDFVRSNYGGGSTVEANLWRITVETPELDKPRTMLISMGAATPAEIGPDGRKIQAIKGDWILGKIAKGSNVSDFLAALKASGFPMVDMASKGAKAIIGASFLWTAVEKTFKVEGKAKTKTYDLPSKFEGFSDAPAGTTVTGGGAPASVDTPEFRDEVGKAAVQALQKFGGSIPRAQLGTRVGEFLPDATKKTQALTLLLKDEFLHAIPGTEYKDRVLKLAS